MRAPALMVGAVAVLLAGAPVSAETGDFDAAGAIERGRKLLQERRYERAEEELDMVASEPRAGAKMRIEALEVLALLHLNHDDATAGRRAFKRLVALDPGHRLVDPAASERARDTFAEVRALFASHIEAAVDVRVVDERGGTSALRLEVSVSGEAEGVDRVALFVRHEDEEAFGRVEMECDGLVCVGVVERASESASLRYYAEAQALSGYVLGSAGSIEEPRDFVPDVRPSAPSPAEDGPDSRERDAFEWYRSWWLWTIVGAVVLAGAAAAVALTWPEEQLDDGSLGPIRLP